MLDRSSLCVIASSLTEEYVIAKFVGWNIKTTEGPDNCGIHFVIPFLNQGMRPYEIYWWICEIYGDIIMSEEIIRKNKHAWSDEWWTGLLRLCKIHVIDVSQSPILHWCFLKFCVPFCMELLLNACVAENFMCMHVGTKNVSRGA